MTIKFADSVQVEELWIKNFKSLRDVHLRLSSLNIVVGPNASGKTNLINALEFIKECLKPIPSYRPWRRWWTARNIVWMRDETLPLVFGFKTNAYGIKFSYEFTCSVLGGRLKITDEVLKVEKWATIRREGSSIELIYDEEFKERVRAETGEKIEDQYIELEKEPLYTILIKPPFIIAGSFHKNFWKCRLHLPEEKPIEFISPKAPVEGVLKTRKSISQPVVTSVRKSLYNFVLDVVRRLIGGLVVIRQLDLKEIKTPQEHVKTLNLDSNCKNLYVVLYNLFLKENKLPDFIDEHFRLAFPDYTLLFDLTEDGRVFVKLKDLRTSLELPPPCMPDGLHKFLAILTALELKPIILAIDELENSMHPQLIELVIDALKASNTTVIVTTHSPAVVDLVEPEDLVLAEMTPRGTVFKRIVEPEKVREELRRLGITLSERWLWGKLLAK